MREEVEHRRPVDAVGPGRVGDVPPVAGALLLVDVEVGDDRLQAFDHRARLAHRHVVVGVAVEHVHALGREVVHERRRVARRGRASEDRLDRVLASRGRAPVVRAERDPAGARTDRREPVGKRASELPRAVASHGVPRQVGAGSPALLAPARERQHLHRVEAAPVLPVEPVRPPVRRADDGRPRLGGVGLRLPLRLHAGAVQRQDERAAPRPAARRGPHRVVLEALVDGARERDAPHGRRPCHGERHLGGRLRHGPREVAPEDEANRARHVLEGRGQRDRDRDLATRRGRHDGAAVGPPTRERAVSGDATEPQERRRRIDDDDRERGGAPVRAGRLRRVEVGHGPIVRAHEHGRPRRLEARGDGTVGDAEEEVVLTLAQQDRQPQPAGIRTGLPCGSPR